MLPFDVLSGDHQCVTAQELPYIATKTIPLVLQH